MKLSRRSFLSGSLTAVAAIAVAPTLAYGKKALPGRSKIVPTSSLDGRPLLIKGGTVLSMDPEVGDLVVGDVLIEGTKISRIASSINAPDALVLDARGQIVMPGFVDTHRHAWEGQLRRINPNSADLMNYIAGTHGSFATRYRPFDMYVGNLLTSIGALDAGITTIIDNSHNSRSIDHARKAIDALTETGIRAVHAPGAPLAGSWEKDSWYDDLAKLKAERFATLGGLTTMAMMTSVDPEQWAVGRKLGVPLVTEFFGKEMSDQLPALYRRGLLGPDNIFNHNTDLSDEAWKIIRSAGVQVNVTPRSDAHWALGSGMFGYQKALDHGLKPGLSIDNESAYGGDMFTEMRVALYLQRSSAQARKAPNDSRAPSPVTMRQLLEAATINGAHVARLGAVTGSLTEGKEADIIIINTDDVNLFPSNNALGTVVGAADRSNVDTVIVGGRIRKQNGKMVGVDFDRLKAYTNESRRYLFDAVGFHGDALAEEFKLNH